MTTSSSSSSSSSSINGVRKGVTVLLFICFLTLAAKSDGSMKEMKVRVGSTPPRCLDKCLSCKPCTATLVASQQHNNQKDGTGYKAKSQEESYYLLSWKCKCGDKLFQP